MLLLLALHTLGAPERRLFFSTSRPPPPSPLPPVNLPPTDGSATFTVTSGFQYCHVEWQMYNGQNLSCVTDGVGEHGNHEACEFRANGPLFASAIYYEIEDSYDFLELGGIQYQVTANPPMNVGMGADERGTWSADASITAGGFVLCATADMMTIHPPSPLPPPPPSASPFPPGAAPPPYYRLFYPDTDNMATCGSYNEVSSAAECSAAAAFANMANTSVIYDGGTSSDYPPGCYTRHTSTMCDNSCYWDSDGDCDDGGPGSHYGLCSNGMDCHDCGPRPDHTSRAPYFNPGTNTGLCSGEHWCLCRNAISPSSPPPVPPPLAPVPTGQIWTVTSGSDHCHVFTGTYQGSYTGNMDNCMTDGDDNYQAYETCVITATRDIIVDSAFFQTESNYDHIDIGDLRFNGNTGPMNVPVATGGTIVWTSDYSVHYGGWILCAVEGQGSPPPPKPPPFAPGGNPTVCYNSCYHSSDGDCDDGGPGEEYSLCEICSDCEDCGPRQQHLCVYPPPPDPSPPPPPNPPALCGQHFCVVSGQQYCTPTTHTNYPGTGTCVHDGAGNHGNNENCLIETTHGARITAVQYTIEANYDYISISYPDATSSTGYTTEIDVTSSGVSAFNNIAGLSAAPIGTRLRWSADYSITRAGFIICFEGLEPPPPLLPPSPSPPRPPLNPGLMYNSLFQVVATPDPPPPPPTPLLPGANPQVEISFTLSGDVSSYGDAEVAAIRSVIAAEAGVDDSDVTVTITSASVEVTATIAVSDFSEAATVESSLSTGMMRSPTALQAAIQQGSAGSSVLAAATVVAAPVVVTTSAPAAALGTSSSSSDSMMPVIIMAVGAAVVVLLSIVIVYQMYKRIKGRASSTVVRAIPTTTIANPVTSTSATSNSVEMENKDAI